MSVHVNNNFPDLLMGRGAAKEIGEILKKAGHKHVFLVHGPNIPKSTIEKVVGYVTDAGLKCTTFGGMEPEVPDTCVYAGVEAAKAAGDIDVMLGVGGGSTMDGTKILNLMIHNPGPLSQYFVRNGMGNPQNPGLPIYLIVTVAGTGSEVDAAAVCVDTLEDNMKNPMGCKLCFWPTLSITDPELYTTLPADYTASSGFDAFCHSYEAYTGMTALQSPLSDRYALDAMSILIEYLPKAVNDLENVEYREQVALGATMGGMATELARNHSGHAVVHAIGSACHAPHGVCAASVEAFMAEYITPVRRERNRKVLSLFGVETPEDISNEELGAKLRDAMLDFCKTIRVKKLKDFGITREQVMNAASYAFNDRITHRFAAEGRDLDMDAIVTMLGKIADEAGL